MRLLLTALLALGAAPLAAQESPDAAARGPKRPTRLFADTTQIRLRIEADFRQIFRDRDTTESVWYPARMSWVAADSGTFAVELTTRGHFRLRASTCSFPPLRVRLPKDGKRGTLFADQGSLKLTTPCRAGNARYEQIVLQEYLVYRSYNLLTDSSFRARLATITYVDTGDNNRIIETHGFFIEDDKDLADRIGMEVFPQLRAKFDDTEPFSTALMSTFLYMVGNTDWSLPYLHNIRLFRRETSYVPIPYDFDWSGVVDAPYARPDYRLGTRSVRERVWRGPCLPPDMLTRVLGHLLERKEGILDLYRTRAGLDPRLRDQSLKYLEEFFAVAAVPDRAARQFRPESCD